ncbi:MAG: translocation/assembly module TamB [Prevotellaceae bacterium]|jgi:hypothetical protein|nr:translocation/assembly module TamB [Prevotellaceae bacterium]
MKRSKRKKVLIILVLVFFVVAVLPPIVLSIPPVQTAIVGMVSSRLSKRLKTRVEVEYVNVRFFNRVFMTGIYVEDISLDTLMYVGKLDADIGGLPFGGRPLVLNKVKLSDGVFRLRSDSAGVNIAQILDNLNDGIDDEPQADNGDTLSSPLRISVKALELENFGYRMFLNDAVAFREQPDGIIYNNMVVDGIALDADGIALSGDTLSFRVNSLSFRERSGFNATKIAADTGFIRFGREVNLKNFELTDDYSEIRMRSLVMSYDGGDKFGDFVNNVNLALDIYDSQVDFKTVAFFAPVLKDMSLSVNLNAHINGTVSNFRSNDFALTALDRTVMHGRFSIAGLPDASSTILFADLKSLRTSSGDVLAVLSGISEDAGNEELIRKFDNLHFKGTFTGFFNDFVSYGNLTSNMGHLSMDVKFDGQEIEGRTGVGIEGKLDATDFNVGALLGMSQMGLASFNVTVDGTTGNGYTDMFGKGRVSSLDFNDYKYRNIDFAGRLHNSSFNGEVNVAEPNLALGFKGRIDAGGEDGVPVFDFEADLGHADLVRLNFNRRDSAATVKAGIKANFKGSSILNYAGEIHIDDLCYGNGSADMALGDITLSAGNRSTGNYLKLESEFADVHYFGQYHLGGFVNRLMATAARCMPELLPDVDYRKYLNPAIPFNFSAQLKNPDDIAAILAPGLSAGVADLRAIVDTGGRLNLSLSAEHAGYEGKQISDLALSCVSAGDSMLLNIAGDVMLPGLTLRSFRADSRASNNRVMTRLSFVDSAGRSDADLSFVADLFRDEEGYPNVTINSNRSKFTVFGQKWTLEPARAELHSGKYGIEGFRFHRNGQSIELDGAVSREGDDSLTMQISNFNLAGINPYIGDKGNYLSGKLSGTIDITGALDAPLILGSIEIDTLAVNGERLGGFVVGSLWNDDLHRLELTARVHNTSKRSLSLNGHFTPGTGKIAATLELDKLSLKPIEPLPDGILSDIDGTADGKILVRGTLRKPELSGTLKLNAVGFKVDYLQTRYTLNSDINVSNSKISVTNGRLTDFNGNSGSLNLELNHDYFQNPEFSATARIRNFVSLKTTERDNPMFYGTTYASGIVNLRGNARSFDIAITAETNAGTKFYIPLSSVSQAKEFDFLTFVSAADSLSENGGQLPDAKSASNMSLELDLSVTPQSEIQILIDPKVDDILRARGRGNLKIKVESAGEYFGIVGDYLIENGEYNFTLPNFSIIKRKFVIDKGSMIRFNGDVSRSVLDVTASYRERVSLAALFPGDSLRNYPVICKISITGRLTNPKLGFDIDIQNLDPEKKAEFKSMVNTDEKITKQFLAVLVLRSFLPEQSFSNLDVSSGALLANASDLLSAQIANLISIFNLPVPIDVSVDYNANSHINPGGDYEFDIGMQLFDRVLINGSVSNTSHSNRGIVGNFEAELMLGKQGNTRFKVFSKSRDYFSDDMESNRNGVGMSYQSQFSKFSDLFRRKRKTRNRYANVNAK